MIGSTASFSAETISEMKFHFIAGWAGYPIVGSMDQAVDSLAAMSGTGPDGVLLSWPRYIQDTRWVPAGNLPASGRGRPALAVVGHRYRT
jgi:FMNH2-dependent dimethyl sulfone monooxygenase